MPPQLKATSVPLFKSTGVPAMNAACCCDVPPDCFCTEPIFRPPCGCVEEDFGTDKALGDAVFTLSGSLISLPFRGLNFNPSNFEWCSGPTCVDIAGSYVVPCNQTVCYNIYQYVCTVQVAFSTPRDIYYETRVTFSYILLDGNFRFACELFSNYLGAPVGDANPAATFDTPCRSASFGLGQWSANENNQRWSLRQWESVVAASSHSVYFFQLGGSCTTDCNSISSELKCISGSQASTSDTNRQPTGDSCAFTDLTISVSVNAPA